MFNEAARINALHTDLDLGFIHDWDVNEEIKRHAAHLFMISHRDLPLMS